ncbi:hypothetical protein QS713_00405 [Gleimia hominis]|uniref:Uncharacterized protein n=1 Tax=Gleimia hominis TaxID=595468 RepID=A0ABU3IBE4_9ACTO|nr:hypothetical protein [Gleimia hominis]MDT3766535.1 hypothetical protein [Gleimia hominis]
MGFIVMLFSALLGIALLVYGLMRIKQDRKWGFVSLLGLISLALAVWLGWPK